MKKVLLVTLFDETNIGNRLQNYALQKILEDQGAEVTILDNYYTKNFSKKTKLKYAIKKVLWHIGYRRYLKECREYDRINRMRRSIRKFNKNNLTAVKRISNREAFAYDWSEYDLAIAGSDQVWHKWRADPDELPFYYLQFMPVDKRASYAASFGFEAFPERDIDQHRIGLTDMKHISCREKTGCALVKELIGREVPQVLDPTLLLKAEEWRALENQAVPFSKRRKPYAFVFFLGEISDDYQAHIDSVMSERGLREWICFSDRAVKECGPCEFLRFIDEAAYVFTDSFHCTAFSVVFDKAFTVFRRVEAGFENMFGRIEDLLASTDKLNAVYGGASQEPKCDLDTLRDTSMHYIKQLLEVTGES